MTIEDGKRRMPDLIVRYQGLRMAIEGEVDDQPDAEKKALEAAQKRVEEGIAHIGTAIVYPANLREMAFGKLKPSIEACGLRIAIVTEAGTTGYVQGTIEYLKKALSTAFDQLLKEDVVAKAVAVIDASIEIFAGSIIRNDAVIDQLAAELGIQELPDGSESNEDEE